MPLDHRSLLAELRAQGLDEEGQPRTSYWKAKLEAQENRVRILDLEEEVRTLRKYATPVSGESEKRVRELEQELRLLKERFHENSVELQKRLAEAKRETQEVEKSRNLWKSRYDLQSDLIDSLRKDNRKDPDTPAPKVSPLGRYPTVRDVLDWMGVVLRQGRILAAGHNTVHQVLIEVGEGKIDRYTERYGVRSYSGSVGLNKPAEELHSIFLPYRRYYEHQTDLGLLLVCQLLGRPLLVE